MPRRRRTARKANGHRPITRSMSKNCCVGSSDQRSTSNISGRRSPKSQLWNSDDNQSSQSSGSPDRATTTRQAKRHRPRRRRRRSVNKQMTRGLPEVKSNDAGGRSRSRASSRRRVVRQISRSTGRVSTTTSSTSTSCSDSCRLHSRVGKRRAFRAKVKRKRRARPRRRRRTRVSFNWTPDQEPVKRASEIQIKTFSMSKGSLFKSPAMQEAVKSSLSVTGSKEAVPLGERSSGAVAKTQTQADPLLEPSFAKLRQFISSVESHYELCSDQPQSATLIQNRDSIIKQSAPDSGTSPVSDGAKTSNGHPSSVPGGSSSDTLQGVKSTNNSSASTR